MNKVADKEELLKVLDEDGNYTGKKEKRSVVHKNKLFHNEVALWIIDKENKQVLLQRRSPYKQQSPNKLAICAGHVVDDETIEETLVKESSEEIGIEIDKYEVKKLTITKKEGPNNKCFLHHFCILERIPLEQLTIQEEELSEVLYMDYEKLKHLIITNDKDVAFENYETYKELFDLLDKIIL